MQLFITRLRTVFFAVLAFSRDFIIIFILHSFYFIHYVYYVYNVYK